MHSIFTIKRKKKTGTYFLELHVPQEETFKFLLRVRNMLCMLCNQCKMICYQLLKVHSMGVFMLCRCYADAMQ
jgi:formate hydrogenlyase subunit 6/NADH:ubiquinone oxidoreductase subunit I